MFCLQRKTRRATAPRLAELLRAEIRSRETRSEGRRTLRRRHLGVLVYKAAKILANSFDADKDFNLMLQVVYGYCDLFGCVHIQEFLDQSGKWIAEALQMFTQQFLAIR